MKTMTASSTRRRGRINPSPRTIFFLLVLVANASLPSSFSRSALPTSLFASAAVSEKTMEDGFEDVEEDAFLAEILAEEARQEEEHAKMEADARERDALQAERRRVEHMMGGKGGGSSGMGGNGSKGGMPNMNNGGGTKKKMGGNGGKGFNKLEEELKKKEEAKKAEAESKKSAATDEEDAKRAEKIRLRREAEFESNLKKMDDAQRKVAKKQKAKDARVVKRLLKAAEANKHYAVLGIRNLEIQIGPFYLPFNLHLGSFVLLRVKTKEIKRTYRNMARTVHPDKNRDGRAEEAFHALETSAALLTDEKKRTEYDKKILAGRRRRHAGARKKVVDASSVVWAQAALAVGTARRVLGPFSTPVLVIGALIV